MAFNCIYRGCSNMFFRKKKKEEKIIKSFMLFTLLRTKQHCEKAYTLCSDLNYHPNESLFGLWISEIYFSILRWSLIGKVDDAVSKRIIDESRILFDQAMSEKYDMSIILKKRPTAIQRIEEKLSNFFYNRCDVHRMMIDLLDGLYVDAFGDRVYDSILQSTLWMYISDMLSEAPNIWDNLKAKIK